MLPIAIELDHNEGVKNLCIDTLISVWPTNLPPVGVVLKNYEAVLQSCSHPQEVADKTLKFVKELLKSECGCLRTAENGVDLKFRSSDCAFAKRENRTYKVESKTIITKAAREGISIVVKDQSTHPENGRVGEDRGSLVTIALPYKDKRYTERFQITCCNFDQTGYFTVHQAVLINFVLRRMEESYLAFKYKDLRPFISKIAGKYKNALAGISVLGATVADKELESLVEDAVRKTPHNYAYFIGVNDRDHLESYPLLVPTQGASTDMKQGLRNGQKQILMRVVAENEGAVVWKNGKDVLFKNLRNQAEVPMVTEEPWKINFSVAVIPLTFEQELLGILWLERTGLPNFTLDDIRVIWARLSDETEETVIKAAGTTARPLRKFVALPSSPEMTRVREQIALATKYPGDAVLISGETGVGKELAARVIHGEDKSRVGKYVAISLEDVNEPGFLRRFFGESGPPEIRGLVHAADRGTLVFDQLESYPDKVQRELLRFMEERMFKPFGQPDPQPVDIRFIGQVTLKENEEESGSLSRELTNRFRKRIYMPPLRRRLSEIDSIINCWLANGELSTRFPGKFLGQSSVELFENYEWRVGNLRELYDVIVEMGENADKDEKKVLKLSAEHLPKEFKAKLSRLAANQP
jgi:two-component system, NtrC family, response regulator AtoC